MIHASAPARVGILGNPSDGYGGRTLGLAVDQYEATVELHPAPGITIVPSPDDHPVWASIGDLVSTVDRFGYGTGTQLLAATVRAFVDVCDSVDHRRPDDFRLSFDTTIPRQVGLGGSSAIVVATLRVLSEHVGLAIPDELLPSIALRVETEHLGIAAGLQDRVVQTYGGLVAMDFGSMETDGRFGVAHGDYERLDPSELPPLFLAYRLDAAEPSDAYHAELRHRFETGDQVVRDTMHALAALVTEGRAALHWHSPDLFASLIERNMVLRRRLGPLPEAQIELVDLAQRCGAAATFAGSGGAIVGCYGDDEQLDELTNAFDAIDTVVVDLT